MKPLQVVVYTNKMKLRTPQLWCWFKQLQIRREKIFFDLNVHQHKQTTLEKWTFLALYRYWSAFTKKLQILRTNSWKGTLCHFLTFQIVPRATRARKNLRPCSNTDINDSYFFLIFKFANLYLCFWLVNFFLNFRWQLRVIGCVHIYLFLETPVGK